jgi:hypothetical protein
VRSNQNRVNRKSKHIKQTSISIFVLEKQTNNQRSKNKANKTNKKTIDIKNYLSYQNLALF